MVKSVLRLLGYFALVPFVAKNNFAGVGILLLVAAELFGIFEEIDETN